MGRASVTGKMRAEIQASNSTYCQGSDHQRCGSSDHKTQFSQSEQQSQYVQGQGKTHLSRHPVAPGIKRRAPLMTCKQPTHDSHSFKEVGYACTQENGGNFAGALPAGNWQ